MSNKNTHTGGYQPMINKSIQILEDDNIILKDASNALGLNTNQLLSALATFTLRELDADTFAKVKDVYYEIENNSVGANVEAFFNTSTKQPAENAPKTTLKKTSKSDDGASKS